MKNKNTQLAFTLMEMLVVMSIMVLFGALALPAISDMLQSNKTGQAESLIKSYLSLAQAQAAKTQHYAGIRFQFDRDGWKNGKQYLALIEQTAPGTDFYAVPNSKPSALPLGVVVIGGTAIQDRDIDDGPDHHNNLGNPNWGMDDATTFSIIFSPTGQIIVKNIEIHRSSVLGDSDLIFNRLSLVNMDTNPRPLLYHDLWPDRPTWCYTENSVTGFYVCELNRLISVTPNTQRYTQYISHLQPTVLNLYTGSILDLEDIR